MTETPYYEPIALTDEEARESITLFREDVKAVRAHTSRVRSALREVPKAIAAHGWETSRTQADEDYLRDLFLEIIGSTTAIAERIGIEL